jgi:hypothetical protein
MLREINGSTAIYLLAPESGGGTVALCDRCETRLGGTGYELIRCCAVDEPPVAESIRNRQHDGRFPKNRARFPMTARKIAHTPSGTSGFPRVRGRGAKVRSVQLASRSALMLGCRSTSAREKRGSIDMTQLYEGDARARNAAAARTYRARKAAPRAEARERARQQVRFDRQQEAIEAARVHIRPAEGSTPAEKLECLRVRSLERLCELASIPIDKIDAALLPVILPVMGNIASRSLAAAIRVDEGALKREDADLVGRLLERFAELRRLEGKP